LEIHCGNCKARFVAYYGTEESADTETLDVEKCGLCGDDPFKPDNFTDAVLRLGGTGDGAECEARLARGSITTRADWPRPAPVRTLERHK
jgi:hypothetical protein